MLAITKIDYVNPLEKIIEDVEVFQNLCKLNPYLVPENIEKINNKKLYIIGFWLGSLDFETTLEVFRKHPEFPKKYGQYTREDYRKVCSKIPIDIRNRVVNELCMASSEAIVRAVSDEMKIRQYFHLALDTKICTDTLKVIIRECENNTEYNLVKLAKSISKITKIQHLDPDILMLERYLYEQLSDETCDLKTVILSIKSIIEKLEDEKSGGWDDYLRHIV